MSRNPIEALLRWFSRSARNLPWRRTRDPYAIWVSEIMLQQTQVKTVIPYWNRWMRSLPDIRALAQARPQRVRKLWEGLGYYSRAHNLHRAAREIVRTEHGVFPRQFDRVFALPGIGRYTAGAICSIAFNQPQPILDGNVSRVLTRWFGIDGDPKTTKTNARLWRIAQDLVCNAAALPVKRACSRFNQALMELGALICTPRNPQCQCCPLASFCVARKTNRTTELPRLTSRPKVVHRRFVAVVCEHNGRILIQQRPPGVVNGLFWELPNAEFNGPGESPAAAARRILRLANIQVDRLFDIKHSITRNRITLQVVRARKPFTNHSHIAETGSRWVTPETTRRLPFTGAHRRVLRKLQTSTGGPNRRFEFLRIPNRRFKISARSKPMV